MDACDKVEHRDTGHLDIGDDEIGFQIVDHLDEVGGLGERHHRRAESLLEHGLRVERYIRIIVDNDHSIWFGHS